MDPRPNVNDLLQEVVVTPEGINAFEAFLTSATDRDISEFTVRPVWALAFLQALSHQADDGRNLLARVLARPFVIWQLTNENTSDVLWDLFRNHLSEKDQISVACAYHAVEGLVEYGSASLAWYEALKIIEWIRGLAPESQKEVLGSEARKTLYHRRPDEVNAIEASWTATETAARPGAAGAPSGSKQLKLYIGAS